MGEIKSTLDIIMEKTKGLTLTEAEKKTFREKEVEGKVKGLLLKFIDGFMDLNHLKKEIAFIGEKDQRMAMEIVTKECLGRIDPATDNRLLFDILEHIAGVDVTLYQGRMSEYQKDLAREQGIREQGLRKRILEKGISGSAGRPNIHADQGWGRYVHDAREKFRKEMQPQQ
jgi:hypothetical protein